MKGPQALPGIASLALPLPLPTYPSTPVASASAGSAAVPIPTLPGMQTSNPGGGGWVLAPASSVIAWPPQMSLAPAPAPQPESSAALLASMLQQLQQQQQNHHHQQPPQQHGVRYVLHQQPPAQPHHEWSGGAGVVAVQPQQAQAHGVPCSMEAAMAFNAPVRSHPPVLEAGDALASMLHRMQQTHEPGGQHVVLQSQDLSAVLLRQHVQSTDPPANMVPTFMSHLGSAAGADEACTHRLSTGSSSWSGSSCTTATTLSRDPSQGSPSNSLSTLLACNELPKSQLHENERQIQHCQVAAAQKSQVDGDSKDGSDDDSTNGTSSLSGASTTPSTKGSESTPPAGQSRYWTEEEHRRFLEAVRCFGAHNHKAIASYVSTRNSTQVRSHSQKFFKKLETFRGRGLPTMLRKRKNGEGK